MRRLADRIHKLIEGKNLFVKECVRLHKQEPLVIKEIKAADGLGLVQSEASADYDGMPHSGLPVIGNDNSRIRAPDLGDNTF